MHSARSKDIDYPLISGLRLSSESRVALAAFSSRHSLSFCHCYWRQYSDPRRIKIGKLLFTISNLKPALKFSFSYYTSIERLKRQAVLMDFIGKMFVTSESINDDNNWDVSKSYIAGFPTLIWIQLPTF